MSGCRMIALLAVALIAASTANAGSTSNASGVEPPEFTNLRTGATVSNPIIVQFAVPAVTMKRAGGNMPSGMPMRHVHLIIDAPLPLGGQMVPMDGRHVHLMHGEAQATLRLTVGDHSLQLVLAGANHHVDNPPIASSRITIHVVPAAQSEKP